MKKEILLYSGIWSWTAEYIISQLQEAAGKKVVMRINTPGGSVMDSYGMIAKFREHKEEKQLKIDGRAASAGAFICCYVDNPEATECLDVSTFLFHRAAYASWFEADVRLFTDAHRQTLITTNNQLRAAMESKFTAEKWKEVTGVSLDDLFSLDSRIDVMLNAQQAKDLGIVGKIVSITPDKKQQIAAYGQQYAAVIAAYAPQVVQQAEKNPIVQHQKKHIVMTIEKLKSEHPDIYAQAVQLGVAQERDRVGAFMAFAHLDLEAVRKGIKDGENLTATQMAEFSLKAFNDKQLKELEAGSPAPTPQAAVEVPAEQTPEAKNEADFDAEVAALLGTTK